MAGASRTPGSTNSAGPRGLGKLSSPQYTSQSIGGTLHGLDSRARATGLAKRDIGFRSTIRGRSTKVIGKLRILAALTAMAIAIAVADDPAFAQKQGGVLRLSHFDSPASMSILEESTVAALRPAMGIFNNLMMYKQDVPQTSLQSIVPDLAT